MVQFVKKLEGTDEKYWPDKSVAVKEYIGMFQTGCNIQENVMA